MKTNIEPTSDAMENLAGTVIQEPDRSLTVTGELGNRLAAMAAARGMSIGEHSEMAVRNFLAESTTGIPVGVYRLAKQINRDHQTLASEIMQAGIEALDNGIADRPDQDLERLCFISQSVGYSHFKEFTITGWIERMSPELMEDCEKEARECDQPLQQIVRERACRGVDLKQLRSPNFEELVEA